MYRKLIGISTLGIALLAASQADAFGVNKKKKPPTPRRNMGVPELSAGPSAASALALLAGGALIAAGRRRRIAKP
jgi:hypothetical protein